MLHYKTIENKQSDRWIVMIYGTSAEAFGKGFNFSRAAAGAFRSHTSKGITKHSVLYLSFSSCAREVSLSVLRAFRINRAPWEANLRAHPAPIPLEASGISYCLVRIICVSYLSVISNIIICGNLQSESDQWPVIFFLLWSFLLEWIEIIGNS